MTSRIRAAAIKKGYRSGFEATIAKQIEDYGLLVEYEAEKLQYIVPERTATYRPDFRLLKKTAAICISSQKDGLLPKIGPSTSCLNSNNRNSICVSSSPIRMAKSIREALPAMQTGATIMAFFTRANSFQRNGC